ncbi:MAG: DUF1499 domain-containing protein [Pseudomonadota bacterium]
MPRFVLTALVFLGAVPALIYAGLTLAFRADMIELGTLFGTLLGPNRTLGWLIIALLAAAVLEIVLAVVSVVMKRASFGGLALALGVISLAMALGPIQMFQTARSEGVPPIHDITTDVQDPPAFIATAAMRTEGMNPPEYDTEQTAQQLEAYPDLVPIQVKASPAEAYKASLMAMKAIGIMIMEADEEAGRVEGTATTRWFGFKDDVVVRVRPAAEGGSIIDIRSKSRIGRSDIRANTDRIRELRRMILSDLGEDAS